MPRKNDDVALGIATVTAVGSILGNLAQALGRAELKAQRNAIRGDRDRLVSVLTQWQRAYAQLKQRHAEAEDRLERLARDFSRVEAELDRQRLELARAATEIERLHAKAHGNRAA
jgi:chromosome segregation ATPase